MLMRKLDMIGWGGRKLCYDWFMKCVRKQSGEKQHFKCQTRPTLILKVAQCRARNGDRRGGGEIASYIFTGECFGIKRVRIMESSSSCLFQQLR